MARRKRDEGFIIILQDVDFTWYKDEIKNALDYWNDGLSLKEISTSLGKSSLETMLLLIDLESKGELPIRNGWIWGRNFKM